MSGDSATWHQEKLAVETRKVRFIMPTVGAVKIRKQYKLIRKTAFLDLSILIAERAFKLKW
ncbi:hypothetical protein VI06_10960 [Aquitalea magnusonii]|nr:hypothetical protein VI06_10960 [Aquitalea magnusonii]